MLELLVGAGFLLAAIVVFAYWLNTVRDRETVRLRLQTEPSAADKVSPVPRAVPFVRRNYWLPWLVGIAIGLGFYFIFQTKPIYAVLPALLIGLLGMEIDRLRVGRQIAKIEAQLVDAIDLMVGSLQAGGSVFSAIDFALNESRWPLRPQLEEVVGRIRLGDDAQTVLAAFAARVPLENFTLFASALSVHWEVGGSLAATLATIGRSIRDRIEIGRRIHSLTAQARVSIIAVLGATYFIALLVWRNNPDRMESFVKTTIGAYVIGFAIMLQALGIVWSTAISRMRY